MATELVLDAGWDLYFPTADYEQVSEKHDVLGLVKCCTDFLSSQKEFEVSLPSF